MLRDAVVEHEQGHGVEVDPDAVLRYVDIAMTEVEAMGGLIFNPFEVDALRRSLEWVQQVISATASTNADVRYMETLGLLGRIGEPEAPGDASVGPLRAANGQNGDHAD